MSKPNKIILSTSYYDHSNRLFQNIQFESFCLEYGFAFENPALANISRFYREPCIVNNSFFYRLLAVQMGRILRKLKVIRKTITIKEVLSRLKLIKSIRFDKNSEENVQILKKYAEANNKVYVEGFYFRPLELTAKYQDLFMRRYGLKDVYYRGNEFVKTFMEKKNEYTVVGIHIRRGDYKTWFNGIFWFEDEVYQRFMDDFLNEYNEINCGKPPFFVVFSNGEHSFKDSPSLLVSHETWYIDHLLLSKCDYIIGPVSTFTLWASYIGKVNYFHIDNRDAQLGLEKFQICRGLFSSE